ncbi:hypothetical protein GDO81_018471 [Engystomops pustulosus]|uniref:Uncharacterized protein n=1 Tax=Engystomops pustulosus TaxID=76066 RepID=A0AAV6ZXN8_ENGPU|nr:hypothetical protein GDO81_018471 [Engystomops pustulosus]
MTQPNSTTRECVANPASCAQRKLESATTLAGKVATTPSGTKRYFLPRLNRVSAESSVDFGSEVTPCGAPVISPPWSKRKLLETLETVIRLAEVQIFHSPGGDMLPHIVCLLCLLCAGGGGAQDTAPLMSVEFTIANTLYGEKFKYSIIVTVTEGSTLLQVMQKAAEISPKHFR